MLFSRATPPGDAHACNSSGLDRPASAIRAFGAALSPGAPLSERISVDCSAGARVQRACRALRPAGTRCTISISVSGVPKPPALVTSHRRLPSRSKPAIGDARQQIAHHLQRAPPERLQDGHGGVAARGNQGFDRAVAQRRARRCSPASCATCSASPSLPVCAGGGKPESASRPTSAAARRPRPRRWVRETAPRPAAQRARPPAGRSARRGTRR